ncbi:hypothetical protein KU43P_25730 [Pseudomonas sp. KU43P]|nr:hypothetical protein KU43P_25730 [Pseudomonas sp. KU43P]
MQPVIIIERMFGGLKENRRIVTRFDKLAKSYAAMVSQAYAVFATSLFVQSLAEKSPHSTRGRLREQYPP